MCGGGGGGGEGGGWMRGVGFAICSDGYIFRIITSGHISNHQ